MFRIMLMCAALITCSNAVPARAAEPVRGMFVTVIQDPVVLGDRERIAELVETAKRTGAQDLFVQVYRANKAWFSSSVADASPYFTCLKKVGEDPLALLIRKAHERGIRVHAWLNLLSLSANTGAPILKKYGPSVLTRNQKKKRVLSDYMIDSQYFLEPGDPRVREELVSMVTELLLLYPALDGVQFDYIRYPDRYPHYGYTDANVRRFKRETGATGVVEGSPEWNAWKRQQVTGLLKLLVQTARKLRPAMAVSTTACAPYIRAYAEAFQDWPSWLKSGLVDFVTLMSYSGETEEFKAMVAEAKEKADPAKVNVAVGAYDAKRAQAFGQQFDACESSGCRGCVIFHYGNLKEHPALARRLEGKAK